MENNNSSTTPGINSQCVLSYELLMLLQWMIEYEAPTLKKIIAHALKNGLRSELQQSIHTKTQEQVETAQYSVLEFFGLLEALMIETINEQAVQTAVEKKLLPAIDHIDNSTCDNEVIRSSVEKTAARLEMNPQANPHDMLFKELLKRWKPTKKSAIN